MKVPRAASSLFSRLFSPHPKTTSSSADLELLIHYRFKDKRLLKQALTHKSSVSPDDRKGLQSNERLEFLGDAVLNFLVTEFLYHDHPGKSEGELSKIKSVVVSRKVLGDVAIALGIDKYVIIDNDAGIGKVNSIASNAFEALIGAIYLDSGIDSVRRFLRVNHFDRIEEFFADKDNTNYKSKILEMAQRDGFGTPEYLVLSSSGPDHDKIFRVQVSVAGCPLGEGVGSNKKAAQQNAAQAAVITYRKSLILSHCKGEQKE